MSKLSVPSSRAGAGGIANDVSFSRQTPGQPHRDDERRATGSSAAGQIGEPCSPQLGVLCRLYTIAEIAEALQLSDSTIRRAIRLKHLAAIKFGRIVSLTAVNVEAWAQHYHWMTRS